MGMLGKYLRFTIRQYLQDNLSARLKIPLGGDVMGPATHEIAKSVPHCMHPVFRLAYRECQRPHH